MVDSLSARVIWKKVAFPKTEVLGKPLFAGFFFFRFYGFCIGGCDEK
jgi:hypothetical protein